MTDNMTPQLTLDPTAAAAEAATPQEVAPVEQPHAVRAAEQAAEAEKAEKAEQEENSEKES